MRGLRTIVWTVFLAVLIGPTATADEKKAPHQFPEELVKFKAYANNPVFRAAGVGHWDERIHSRAWIVRDPDNRYYMWYTGFKKTGPMKLGYATSFDGLKWRRHRANPVHRMHDVKNMTVLERYGVFYMFASGKNEQAQLLTSPDRVHWTRRGGIKVKPPTGGPTPALSINSPSAWYGKGKWHLLFSNKKSDAVYLTTSKRLRTWSTASAKPVLSSGPGAYDKKKISVHQLFRYRGKFYVYYHGMNDAGAWSTNIAASDDLIKWEKYAKNPINKGSKSAGMVVYDGNRFRLYTINNEINVHFSKRVRAEDLTTN